MTTAAQEPADPFAGFEFEAMKDGEVIASSEMERQAAAASDKTKADATGKEDVKPVAGLRVDEVPDEDKNEDEDEDEDADEDEDEDEDADEDADEDEDDDDLDPATKARIDALAKEKAKRMARGRIGQLTAKNRELERLLASKSSEPPSEAKSLRELARERMKNDPKAPKAPDPSKYEFGELDNAYRDDYYDYRDELKTYLAEVEHAISLEQAYGTAAPEVVELSARIEEFEKSGSKVKGFAQAMKAAQAQEFPVSLPVAQFIVDSDVGHELTVYLHQNTKLAKEIDRLPPIRQIARLVKLEDQIVEERNKRRNKAPAAPAPIKQARGASSPKPQGVESEDFAEAEKALRAALR